ALTTASGSSLESSAIFFQPLGEPSINPGCRISHFLVALPRTRDLLLFAKHLFAAAMRWQTEEIWSPLSFTEGDHDVFPDDPAPVAFRRHPYRPDNSARDGGAVHRTPLCRGQSAAHQQ